MWAAMAVHWAAGVGTGCGVGWLPRKTSGSLPAMTLCNVSSSAGVHFSRVRGLTFAGMFAVVLALQCCLCYGFVLAVCFAVLVRFNRSQCGVLRACFGSP